MGRECNYRVASLSEVEMLGLNITVVVCHNWMKYCWHRQASFADAGYKVFSQAARYQTCHVQQVITKNVEALHFLFDNALHVIL